ncbi:MAG: DNA-directed RNA polymerase subunit alpha, partial [Candidatus Dependentiae bacterium]|nr:DNA-directed RNA polymerase subunit alpha [Candidatus Dependentiae bacterium]
PPPLTIPKVGWDNKTLNATQGQLTAQPLEPGFGVTLGNALRRILLGGIEGSAVTAVVIKGVNNEFSALPGVVEDTMQLVLNIKEIVVRNKTGQPGQMRLLVKGEAEATVADITADEHLELLNKEHILGHVAAGGTLDIQFFVEPGRGYAPAKWPIAKSLQEDGRIYLDAMFAPVRKVAYDVQKTRVGSNIDYDRLILTVTTDGTETPVDVMNYAVSVLRTQLEHFLTTQEIPFNEISAVPVEEGTVEPEQVEVTEQLQGVPVDLLLKPIDALEFSVRAHNCLVNAGITRIVDLVNLTEDELQKIKNFGRKSFDEVRDGIRNIGLSFGMHINEADLKALKEKE